MTSEIRMPRLSDTMEEGTVVRWLKQPGDQIRKGEPVVEIVTEKATLTIDADTDGVLEQVLVAEGTAGVGALLGIIASGRKCDSRSSAVLSAADMSGDSGGAAASASPEVPPVQPLARIRATPIARLLAAQAGADLSELGEGTGPSRRILKADVERWITTGAAISPLVGQAPGSEMKRTADEILAPTRMQEVVARRMSEAKRQVPHYYVDAEIDMEEALRLQAHLAALEPPVQVSLNDLVVRAAALALREVPAVNASWVDGQLVRRASVNVGIAVALDNNGLIVPVVRDADRKSLVEIAAESRPLVERARGGKAAPAELDGGTFTVSNLGMLGVTHFYAIITPPQSGVLAVGTVVERPAVRDSTVVVRRQAMMSLSADHRVYSGATAAAFLQAIGRLLEQPLRLLLPAASAIPNDPSAPIPIH